MKTKLENTENDLIKLSNGLSHKYGQKIIKKRIYKKNKEKIFNKNSFLNFFPKFSNTKTEIIDKGRNIPTILAAEANAEKIENNKMFLLLKSESNFKL